MYEIKIVHVGAMLNRIVLRVYRSTLACAAVVRWLHRPAIAEPQLPGMHDGAFIAWCLH